MASWLDFIHDSDLYGCDIGFIFKYGNCENSLDFFLSKKSVKDATQIFNGCFHQ